MFVSLPRVLCDDHYVAGATLPSHFYLQLDNTAKQNKSQYMFGYLGSLVYRGVFKQVVVRYATASTVGCRARARAVSYQWAIRTKNIDQLFSRLPVSRSFLPVGHTHEDIDQFFSRVSVWLRVHNAASRRDLAQACSEVPSATIWRHSGSAQAYRAKDGSRPLTGHIENAANFSHYVKPFLNNLAGISKYHQFRLVTQRLRGTC